MRPLSILVLVLSSVLSSVLSGQSGSGSLGIYGTGTVGKGGFVPRAWITGQPSLGKPIQFDLDQALGRAVSGLLLSLKPADLPFLNLRLYVDMSPTLSLIGWMGAVGGTAGVGGSGSQILKTTVPSQQSLVGTSFYLQWLVADSSSSSGLVASNANRITISSGPLVLAGGSGLVDYVPGNASATAGPPASNVNDIQLNQAGSMAFVTTPKSLTIYDLRSRPYKVIGSQSFLGAGPNNVSVHPNQERAYVCLPHRTAPAVAIIDIKPGSRFFGKSIGQVQSLPASGMGDMEGSSISANGKVLVVAVLGLAGSKSIVVIDVDPASPNRDKFVRQIIPTVSGYITDVDVSADGKIGYACFAPLGASSSYVAMIDLASGIVLKSVNHSGMFSVDIDLDPRGRFLVVANPNSYNLTLVDLTPGANFFKTKVLASTAARFFSVALTPDGSIAFAIGNGSPGDIYGFDTSGGTQVYRVATGISGAAIAVR